MLACAIAAVSCGPELSAPGSGDVSGTWFSPGPAAGLTNVTIVLTQSSDASISGTYTATGTPNLQFCPATGPCAISGTIAVKHTLSYYHFPAPALQLTPKLHISPWYR